MAFDTDSIDTNRTALQPATLGRDHFERPTVVFLPVAPASRIEPALARPVPASARNQAPAPVRLEDLKLSATPPSRMGGHLAQAHGLVAQLINEVEASRAAGVNGSGELSPLGGAMLRQLQAIGQAYERLCNGPTLFDGGIEGMREFDALVVALRRGMLEVRGAQGTPPLARQAETLDLVPAEPRDASTDRSPRAGDDRSAGDTTSRSDEPWSEEHASPRHSDDTGSVPGSPAATPRASHRPLNVFGLDSESGGPSSRSGDTFPSELPGFDTPTLGSEARADAARAGDVLADAIDRVGREQRHGIAAPASPAVPRPDAVDLLAMLTDQVCAQLDDRKTYLAHGVLDSVQSVGRMYEAKAQICAAAAATLARRLSTLGRAPAAGRPALDDGTMSRLWRAQMNLEWRAGALSKAAVEHASQTAEPRQIVGRKPVRGLLGWLRQLPFAWRQRRALDDYATRLSGRSGPNERIPLNTPEIDEQTIVEETLLRAFRDAGLPTDHVLRDFRREMARGFNSTHAWNEISHEMQLQVGTETLFAYSQIRPAGCFLLEYDGRGVCSHDTSQSARAVNLAQTRLVVGEHEPLFSAMRHGVASATALTPENIAPERMSDEELVEHTEALLPDECVRGATGDVVNVLATAQHVRADPRIVERMRAIANENRLEDVVRAMVVTDPALLRDAVQAYRVAHGEGGSRQRTSGAVRPPVVDVLSISLLTPDGARREPDVDERRMLKDQCEAWRLLTGPRDIEVRDPESGRTMTVRVDIQPVPVNYGVQAGRDGGPGRTVDGEDDVRAMNDAGLSKLVGDPSAPHEAGLIAPALSHLAQECATLDEMILLAFKDLEAVRAQPLETPGRRAAFAQADSAVNNARELAARGRRRDTLARELVEQVQQLRADGGQRPGRSPYAMPARLALLADLAGVRVAFNCRSGNERSGELDAEIKHLRLQMELHGHVPQVDRMRSDDELHQFEQVITRSGNFELQRLNTGYAGYRQQGAPDLAD